MNLLIAGLLWLSFFLGVDAISAQTTQIDLRTQARSVDFSNAPFTRPVKTASSLPGTCSTGDMVVLTAATPGQNLNVCTGPNTWSLQAGEASRAVGVQRTSDTVLTVGAGCSTTDPCKVRMGNSIFAVIGSVTITLSGGTGDAFIYLTQDGVLTVGHALSLNCVGDCVAQPGVVAFPTDVLAFSRWSASNGVWNSTGSDVLTPFGKDSISAGTGLIRTTLNGSVTLGVDSAVIGVRLNVPTASISACTLGNWAADNNFYYLCVAANSWKRVAVASW